mmetsp:Transcript_20825/g.46476  ORF Transcript_20825/g.46476 Transcript_20825/m.46476 type:complete len:673 (-) Transcript_20825:78-2096(-)
MRATLIGAAIVVASGEHPIKKVIGLIKDLKQKALEEGQEEEIAYTKFSRWCKSGLENLKNEVAKSKTELEELEQAEQSQNATINEMIKKIEVLEGEITNRTTAKDEAETQRGEDNQAYLDEQTEIDDTITAVDEAITALKDGKSKVESDTAMLQARDVLSVLSDIMTTEQQKKAIALLAQPDVPEAKKYEFKGDKAIELLEELKHEFEGKKFESEKGEINSKNSYDLAQKAQTQAIEAATAAKDKKTGIKTTTEGELADTQGSITDTNTTLTNDEETLSTTSTTCKTRAEEWEERSKTRAQEMKAMETAIKILQKAAGVREAPATDLLQAGKVGRHNAKIPDAVDKSVALLKGVEKRFGASDLASLVTAISELKQAKSPFEKVQKMLQKMIFRLQAEQKAEATHKSWCDNEVEETTQKETDFLAKKTELKDTIDGIDANLVKMDSDLGDLEKDLKDVRNSINELKADRKEDHEDNMQDVKDAEQAQKALANAQVVLKEHYEKSGGAQSLMQRKDVELTDEPDLWESSYSGVSGSQGILDMLESVANDYAHMESEARADEATNEKEFEKEQADLETNKKHTEESIRLKTNSINNSQQKLSKKTQQHDDASDRLEAAETYHQSLHKSCYGDATDYEEVKTRYEARQTARKNEIDALKDAQKSLQDAFKEGEDAD